MQNAMRCISPKNNNINLPLFRKTRQLHILMDCEMNFKEHIYNITGAANQRVFSN